MFTHSFMIRRFIVLSTLLSPLLVVAVKGQTASPAQPPSTDETALTSPFESLPGDRAQYVLGPGDQVTVHILGAIADDFPERPVEVGPDGKVNLPMVGDVQASGVSVRDLEGDLKIRYGTYFKDPQVSVAVTDYRSQPVSVVGAVNAPNVVELHGPTRLMQVISMAGGLRPDAGDRVLITRQLQPAAGGAPPSGSDEEAPKFYLKEVSLAKALDGTDPAANVLIEGHDVITVPKAKMVYVMGAVGKPGGYILDGHSSSLSVLQAIALAGGLTKTAKGEAKILNATSNGGIQSENVLINISKIEEEKSPDVRLRADDILYVPNSTAKSVGYASLAAAVNLAGVVIWKF